jgi:hypothetical protein
MCSSSSSSSNSITLTQNDLQGESKKNWTKQKAQVQTPERHTPPPLKSTPIKKAENRCKKKRKSGTQAPKE